MFTLEDEKHLGDIRGETVYNFLDTAGLPQDVALLDAPALVNVGDSMIWEGQLAYMERLSYRVRYVSDMQSFDAKRLRRRLAPGSTVFLRGGGNFGDVWVGHQKFREIVARELPDYRIVQLTQSVLFRDPDRAALANDILRAHPDFQLFIRDEKSLARAEHDVPDVPSMMSYDMALGWEPKKPATVGTRAIVIARDDREASSGLLEAATSWDTPYDVHVTDWMRHQDHPEKWHKIRRRLQLNGKVLARKKRHHLPIPTLPQRVVEADLAYLNSWNVDYAVDLFGTAKAMVVDRLHAHVLASLLGIPHVVLDNDHGKISTVYEAYTGQFSTAHYTTSTDEAREILDELMSS